MSDEKKPSSVSLYVTVDKRWCPDATSDLLTLSRAVHKGLWGIVCLFNELFLDPADQRCTRFSRKCTTNEMTKEELAELATSAAQLLATWNRLFVVFANEAHSLHCVSCKHCEALELSQASSSGSQSDAPSTTGGDFNVN